MTAPAAPKPRRKSVGRARFGLPPSSLHSPTAAPVWTYPHAYTRDADAAGYGPVYCDHPVYEPCGADSNYARALVDDIRIAASWVEDKHGDHHVLYDEDGDAVDPWDGDIPASVKLTALSDAADDIETDHPRIAKLINAYVAKERAKNAAEQAARKEHAERLFALYITETRRGQP